MAEKYALAIKRLKSRQKQLEDELESIRVAIRALEHLREHPPSMSEHLGAGVGNFVDRLEKRTKPQPPDRKPS